MRILLKRKSSFGVFVLQSYFLQHVREKTRRDYQKWEKDFDKLWTELYGSYFTKAGIDIQ